MDFVQQTAFGSTFGKSLFQDTLLAGTFDKISDFKIVFVFEIFFYHLFSPNTLEKIGCLSQDKSSHKSNFFLKIGYTRPFWRMISPPVPGLDKTPL